MFGSAFKVYSWAHASGMLRVCRQLYDSEEHKVEEQEEKGREAPKKSPTRPKKTSMAALRELLEMSSSSDDEKQVPVLHKSAPKKRRVADASSSSKDRLPDRNTNTSSTTGASSSSGAGSLGIFDPSSDNVNSIRNTPPDSSNLNAADPSSSSSSSDRSGSSSSSDRSGSSSSGDPSSSSSSGNNSSGGNNPPGLAAIPAVAVPAIPGAAAIPAAAQAEQRVPRPATIAITQEERLEWRQERMLLARGSHFTLGSGDSKWSEGRVISDVAHGTSRIRYRNKQN
jgi:hypothetical protein